MTTDPIQTIMATTSFILPSATASGSFNTLGVSPTPGPQPPNNDEGSSRCELLGPFSLLVQAALGALALLVLVYKRWKERPQRPLKIWTFDVSKQVFGSALMHLANLLASLFSAGQIPVTADYHPNPCTYYLLNLGIDVSDRCFCYFLFACVAFPSWRIANNYLIDLCRQLSEFLS